MKIRLLAPAETRLALNLLDADPVLNLGLIHNITKSGLNNLGLIGQGSWLGRLEGGDLTALLCHDNQGVWRFQVNEFTELLELAGAALREGMRPVLFPGEARLVDCLLDAMGGEMGYLKLVEDEVMLLLAAADFRPCQDREARYAVPADLEQVAALEEGLQRELLGPDSWRKAAVRRYASELIQQRHTVICAADGQAVSKADLEVRTTQVASLGGVFTLPAYRGRGHAASACSSLCADVLASGAGVPLNTDARNLPALALYRSLGFHKHRDYKVAVFNA
jgi:hypothetical protein